LAAWEAAPSARAAHPREEHLLPLMVAVGAARGDMAELTYHEKDFLGGLTVSSYCFSKSGFSKSVFSKSGFSSIPAA
jgi:aromatic ring-opening dioxygenase catalytic subunit (LigB family)